MSFPEKLKGRYELREALGQGGMGVVFRAWDSVVKREVALKTLRDAPTRAAVQMFFKECEVLAALSHPNIIEIFDLGEFEEDGKSKPYFVMPLLPGATLEKLIQNASHRLSVERVVEIICQACRGLQAAHERSLIHRDIKPSNLWVMDDDSVKIIDFGVAQLVQMDQSVSLKGTLVYMSPEQLQMKPATPASDIYSLAVTSYEALTRRRPFEGTRHAEIAEAILTLIPPPACDINPAVSQTLSRAVHKALAKQPWNRYSSAREFAETLQKASRNEAIEFFNPARIQPRIERASHAFDQGDPQFALEILYELEAEGHIDPAIAPLRKQIEHSQRQKTIGQLLNSARTRFEHEELPLALQKVEEILQIEPGNAQALGLRTSIENKMVTQKIGDWLRLARQHLANQAYSHAREAVRNVLQLRPNDQGATQLMAEIDKREQEFHRFRKEKQDLYNSALEAYNAGEVTTALSKIERVLELDKIAPESSVPDRADSYQSFYNKVRTEHESMKNSYAEARKLLAARNFAQALAIANEWLNKYPSHALFQALKFDIEEQQRQEISARIAEVDRQVDAEPDLDRRVHMLEQAVAEFPGETHFERQLRPMRDKRDLVNSIAAKARYHEERGQLAEAHAQWEILGTIYPQYPGLSIELERIAKKKDQQALTDAKLHWAEQIDRAIATGEYDRALALCATADAEFPNDPELAQLRQLATESAARAQEAQKSLAQGQALWQQQWFDDALACLNRAIDLDPKNTAVRAAVVELLVERGKALVDSDWRAAEPFIDRALELDPGHVLAKSLRITARDQKRDEAVVRCFTAARQFRASGDFENALAEADKCFAEYPLDPRLAQLREILTRELQEARGAAPPAGVSGQAANKAAAGVGGSSTPVSAADEMPTLVAPVLPDTILTEVPNIPPPPDAGFSPTGMFAAPPPPPMTSAPEPPPVEPQPAAPPAPPPAPPERRCAKCSAPLSATARFCTGCGTPVAPAPAAPPAGERRCAMCNAPLSPSVKFCTGCGTPIDAAPSKAAVVPPPPAPKPAAPAPVAKPAAAAPPPGPAKPAQPAPKPGVLPPPAQPPAGKKNTRKMLIWGGVGAGIVALLAGLAILLPKLRKPVVPSNAVRVEVRTLPPGAVIRVNGKIRGTSNFQWEEAPGVYAIEATLEGYQTASTTAELKPGLTAPVELTLQPLPQTVRLITDLNDGKVTLDDQPARDLQDGQLTLDSVSPGRHTLKFASKTGQAELAFELVPGGVPLLNAAPAVKGIGGLIVSSFANRARVYSTLSPARIQVDGAPSGEAGPEGLQVTNLGVGTHELVISDGKIQVKKVIEISNAPALTAFLQSDQNVGTMVVLTGSEDGVDVFIDGQKYRRQTARGGQIRIQREPKQYRVRVAKQGFQDVPEQTIEIKRGEEIRVTFQLVPLPTSAHLALQGAPGAQVFIDDAAAGTVLADGTFQISALKPGEHTIELRKDKQRSHTVKKTFAAGQTVTIAESEVALRGGSGTLRLSVTPANAQITVARAGRPPQSVPAGTVELEEGAYTVTARAAGYGERSEHVQIAGGQTATVSLVLLKDAASKQQAAATGMEAWEDAAGWTQNEGWFVRRGGGFVLYKSGGRAGVFEITLMAASGGLLRGKNLEWVAAFTDARNYVLFRLERDNFRRIFCENGKRTEMVKKPHGLKLKDMVVSLHIQLAPSAIQVQANDQGRWVTLDDWSAPGRNFAAGRFGLLIEGRDEVRVSNFKFTPKE